MSLTVVTPWRDHLELADDYFAALNDCLWVGETIIVDDGSHPPLDFGTIRFETSVGFTRACNAGLNMAQSDKVLFLNNDIEPVDGSDWLTPLAEAIEDGVLAGCRLRSDAHARVRGVDDPLAYLDGWCLGGTRGDLLRLGGFDESYDEPAYYSDNDLCLRARCEGMRLREVRVSIYHKTSQTTGFSVGATPERAALLATNYTRYADRARDLLGLKVPA